MVNSGLDHGVLLQVLQEQRLGDDALALAAHNLLPVLEQDERGEAVNLWVAQWLNGGRRREQDDARGYAVS